MFSIFAKNMVMDGKNQKALALLCLVSRPSPNAANSSDINFDAE